MFTYTAAIGPGGFTVIASYAGCEKRLVILFFTLAMFFMGFYYSGQKLSPLDLSPAFSGTITAVTNGLGSISGFLSPVVVGWMTPEVSKTHYIHQFISSSVSVLISGLINEIRLTR